jgi:hypothetical protein
MILRNKTKPESVQPLVKSNAGAHSVQRAREARVTASNHINLQRTCACGGTCEECRKKRLQRDSSDAVAVGAVPRIVNLALRHPGRPLDTATRQYMESRFGEDFGGVRVHTAGLAAESAAAVHARAFTVGHDIVFAASRYSPRSSEGRRLLSHELTHVVQQRAAATVQELRIGEPGDNFEREADAVSRRIDEEEPTVRLRTTDSPVQRDLATPPPAVAAAPQIDLTDAQIQEAIRFNRARYDERNTRLIQDLLGGPVTGTWNEENIVAIAATQEEYGLTKDGKVGDAMFRFLNREQRLENSPTTTANCLVSFRLVGPGHPPPGRIDATHCNTGSHFRIEAQFSERCHCDQFQYRQFITGHLHRTRARVVTDVPMPTEPGGVMPAVFTEDADITDVPQNYGHRDQPADAAPVDHYVNSAGVDDQAHGCRYVSEDTPGGTFDDCLAGDRYDFLMRFRGEIQRNGAPIESKFWTAIKIVNWTP